MLVGITYDLRQDYLDEGFGEEETAEFDRPDTIDAITGALEALGYQTDRIGHVRHLVARLAAGDRWDLVFNIAEGLRGFGREAQVPALLEAYGIPHTFSDTLVSALTLHKAYTKNVVRDSGIPTPNFAVVERIDDVDQVMLAFPVFAKPVAEGTGKGVTAASKARNPEELRQVCSLLLQLFDQPVLVEEYLPGREFTVGIVGTGPRARSVGVIEVILRDQAEAEVYSYINKERCELLVEYRLVDDEEAREAARTAIAAWRVLGCCDAGRVDLRSDGAGVPSFMEVNPLAGLHPEHSDLPIICTHSGIGYLELIRDIMTEASLRGGLPTP